MPIELNVFQKRTIETVAALADAHPCIRNIYIFGSVARGETASCNDIDLAVGYHDVENRYDLSEDYVAFQATYDDWAEEAGEKLGRPIRFARLYITDRDDEVWAAIQREKPAPVAIQGKAIMVATPSHKIKAT